jgi:pimeloyl-ACP methyl ester carboxylesterase
MQRGRLARRALAGARVMGSYTDQELDVYDEIFRDRDAASATVHLYRSFLVRELPAAISGALAKSRLTVPTLWLIGSEDPVGKTSGDGYRDHADDMTFEWIPGAGHFLPEEMPGTVLEKVQAFL